MLGWAIHRGEWTSPLSSRVSESTDPLSYHRRIPLLLSILLAFWAFILFGDNRFTMTNVIVWSVAVILFIRALWLDGFKGSLSGIANFFKETRGRSLSRAGPCCSLPPPRSCSSSAFTRPGASRRSRSATTPKRSSTCMTCPSARRASSSRATPGAKPSRCTGRCSSRTFLAQACHTSVSNSAQPSSAF
jgi:hypothetical protein